MIDWARVNDLCAEIGAEDFEEVAALFLDEADEAVALLDGKLDAKALESRLHFLKGAALNLGFRVLAGQCQEGERRAAGGSTDVDLIEIQATYHASKAAFVAGRAVALSA